MDNAAEAEPLWTPHRTPSLPLPVSSVFTFNLSSNQARHFSQTCFTQTERDLRPMTAIVRCWDFTNSKELVLESMESDGERQSFLPEMGRWIATDWRSLSLFLLVKLQHLGLALLSLAPSQTPETAVT